MQSVKSYNAIYCDLLQLLQFETAQARKPNKCYISSTDSQKYITRSTLLLKASLVPQKSWKVQPWKQPYGFYFEIISSRKKKKKRQWNVCEVRASPVPDVYNGARSSTEAAANPSAARVPAERRREEKPLPRDRGGGARSRQPRWGSESEESVCTGGRWVHCFNIAFSSRLVNNRG